MSSNGILCRFISIKIISHISTVVSLMRNLTESVFRFIVRLDKSHEFESQGGKKSAVARDYAWRPCMREPVCLYKRIWQGYHSDSFSFSEFFCTTKWLCQFDAVCSTASSQTSRRRLCTLLVSTSIIHMISDQRHIKEDLSWCHSLGLPFFLSEVPVCKLLCRASARLS